MYNQTVLETTSFDLWFLENVKRFDKQFEGCFKNLQARWNANGLEQKQICDGHDDPTWRKKCHQENYDQQLSDWGTSLRQVIDHGKPWTETTSGQAMTVVWSQCKLIEGGCQIIRDAVEQVLPLLQPFMVCR